MIVVLSAGVYSTIQDLGRFGHRNIGVPVSGSMDQYSAFIANSLVGNNNKAAVLEMTFNGPSLKFNKNATIAIVGSPIKIKLNDNLLAQNSVITINKGDTMSLGTISHGVRSYLAIAGGFNTEVAINSRSYYPGITHKSQLKKGDIIHFNCHKQTEILNRSSVHLDEQHFSNKTLQVYPAPEFHTLSTEIKAKILRKKLIVSSSSNRMAYKFESPITIGPGDSINEIITSSVQPGTVQLTPSGEIIVLMRDCQTTGGYARIFQLAEQSINQLSQKTTASELKFSLVNSHKTNNI